MSGPSAESLCMRRPVPARIPLWPRVALLTWSEFPIRRLLEIGFVWIVVIGFEVAKHWRHWIATVVGNGYGLCIAQLCKSLHVETIVALLDVAFRCRDVGPVREGLPGYPECVAARYRNRASSSV